ncbi:hypothetical protein PQX77_002343 [Marasmius sp. AFHP31]|nr:hypothetical protein PQX77_002343 [Marasmius sp. AFHP31]
MNTGEAEVFWRDQEERHDRWTWGCTELVVGVEAQRVTAGESRGAWLWSWWTASSTDASAVLIVKDYWTL